MKVNGKNNHGGLLPVGDFRDSGHKEELKIRRGNGEMDTRIQVDGL